MAEGEDPAEGEVGEQRRAAEQRQHQRPRRGQLRREVVAETAQEDGEQPVEHRRAAGKGRRLVERRRAERDGLVRPRRDEGAASRRQAHRPGQGLRARPVAVQRSGQPPLPGEGGEERREGDREQQERRQGRSPVANEAGEPGRRRSGAEAPTQGGEQPPREVGHDQGEHDDAPVEQVAAGDRVPGAAQPPGGVRGDPVPGEGREADPDREIPEPRAVEGEDDREDIRREEVPVHHLRQEERRDDQGEEREEHHRLPGHLEAAPVQETPNAVDQRDGERDAQRPEEVVVVRDPVVEVRDFDGEPPVAQPEVEVDREEVERRAPRHRGGNEQQQEHGRNQGEPAGGDPLPGPQPVEERGEEQRLPLHGEGYAEGDEGAGVPAGEEPVEAYHQERGVEGVRLPPAGRVQHHGGREQHRRAGQDRDRSRVRIAEANAAVGVRGEEQVPRHRDRLDRQQLGNERREVRRRRQQVEVGRVVVGELVTPGGRIPVRDDEVVPGAQEVAVIVGLEGEERNADREGGEQGAGGERDLPESPTPGPPVSVHRVPPARLPRTGRAGAGPAAAVEGVIGTGRSAGRSGTGRAR